MSPIRPTRARSQRSMVLAVSGLVLGLVLVLVVFIYAIPSLTSSGKVEVHLGPDRFDAGPADARAAEVAERGPLLFPDVAGNERDIFVQHLGTDAQHGWLAFDARQAGASRNCTLEWNGGQSEFVDPCDGSRVDEDGDGLTQYSVQVTDAGQVVVDLRNAG